METLMAYVDIFADSIDDFQEVDIENLLLVQFDELLGYEYKGDMKITKEYREDRVDELDEVLKFYRFTATIEVERND